MSGPYLTYQVGLAFPEQLAALRRDYGGDWSLSYLAQPFTSDPDTQAARLSAGAEVAAELHGFGFFVYAPCVYGDALDRLSEPAGYGFWMRHCLAMVAKCDALFALKLPGWQDSNGMRLEVARAKACRIPVVDLIV